MSGFCTVCGIPLAVGNESGYCSEHGGLEAQIRCPFCMEKIFAQARKCRYCGEYLTPAQTALGAMQIQPPVPAAAPVRSGEPRSKGDGGIAAVAESVFAWIGRHPVWAIILTLLVIGFLSQSVLNKSQSPNGSPASSSQQSSSASQGSAANTQGLATGASQTGAQPTQTSPPPKFRVFKFKTDVPTSYVVPVKTSDDELKSLLWLFRQSVRAGNFKKIGITQPTAKQWGQLGYTSGMLVVFRGEKCANEDYISDADLDKGKLGPCGYGEHDDAYYQWGIDANPNKDAAGITDKNGNSLAVFDYKDNWHPSSEALQGPDQRTKEAWQARQQEWEPMQRFAVQVTNELNKRGLNVDASANENQPRELDVQSPLFKNATFRNTFLNNALPQLNHDFCNVGFRSVRIFEAKDSEAGQSYPLHCK